MPVFEIAENFDESRALLFEKPNRQPLLVEITYHPLNTYIKDLAVPPETPVLVMEIEGTAFIFLTLQVIHHGILQGVAKNTPWFISFCRVCNGGVCFSPLVDEVLHHFAIHGMYNSMSLMADLETRSFWDHITGVCVHGQYKGQSLKQITPLLHMNIEQALAQYPEGQLVLSSLNPEQQAKAESDNAFRINDQRETPEIMIKTMGPEDTRLPRLTMGLGVWSDTLARYYPFVNINALDNAILDDFEGERLLVYIDPNSQTPQALYTSAKTFSWRGDLLYLEDGSFLQDGALYNKNHQRQMIKRPFQLFHRWFGFAYSFPGCEIYQIK